MADTDIAVDGRGMVTPRAVGPEVWDRVWQTPPPDAKDDARLARERHHPRFQLIVDRLLRTFGSLEGLRTIELGSGRGDLSVLLAQHGADVTLLDYSARALAEARSRFNRLRLTGRFVGGDLLSLDDGYRGRFDVSFSYGVIEHFAGAARQRTVHAHHDVLRPGGLAIISVPYALCAPYRMWKWYLQCRGWWPYGMEIPYTRAELIGCARRVGFARTEAHCLAFWHSLVSHLCKPLLGWNVDWAKKSSRLDRIMGSILLMFAWRRAEPCVRGKKSC